MEAWLPAVVAAGLVLVPPAWALARHVVTLVHEAGHALAALLTGRRLRGIRLHRDTSGLTVSAGRPRGPGMVLTAAAGFLAAPLLGLLLAALAAVGGTRWSLGVAVAVLALVLLWVRNLFGLLVVVLCGAGVYVLVRWASVPVQEGVAAGAAWFLLLGGLRTTLELWPHRRRSRSRTSDADVLARLTHVPAAVWNVLLVAAALGALVLATSWLPVLD